MSGKPDGVPTTGTRPAIYPMTREQEALWIDDLVSDGPSRYLESWACRLTGPLDRGALEWALGQVIARHEVLRSRLTEKDEEPVQIVVAPGTVQLQHTSCPAEALTVELSRIVAEPLDLNEAPIRPWLVCVSAEDFVLVVKLHHAVVDDWSLNILRRELMHFYTARVLGRQPSLEPLRMQAGDFAIAQQAAGLDPADLAYWRERVRAAPPSCTVPPDRPAPAELPHRAGLHPYEISAELAQAVRAAGRRLRATSFTVFAGAMAALLWWYGKAEDVIFGTPVSLRGAAAVDGMIGYLTNLLPLRVAVSPALSFRKLTHAVKAEVLGALEHRAVPYSTIVRMSRHWAATDAPPPCATAIVVDDMRWEPFSLPEIAVEALNIPAENTKFALLLAIAARDDGGYAGNWVYDAEVFDAATIARVADRFTRVLAGCIAAPDEPLDQIPDLAAGAGVE